MVYSRHDHVMLFHTSPMVKNAPAHVGDTMHFLGREGPTCYGVPNLARHSSRARARCSPCSAAMKSSRSPQLEKAMHNNNPSRAENK